MNRQVVLPATFLALAAHAVSQVRSKDDPIFNHTVEPVVIRDGSVKVDVYARSAGDVRVPGTDSLIVSTSHLGQASFNVPVGVVAKATVNSPVGSLRTTQGLAHPSMLVDSYVYDVEKLEGRQFVPYAQLVFTFENSAWHISPKGPNPLKLVSVGKPVTLTGAWAKHIRTTYEYGYGDLQLRVGAVTVISKGKTPARIQLGTGCSSFRIEPNDHQPHAMPFEDPPCLKERFPPQGKYPPVRVDGVSKIVAIDVSLEKPKP